MTDYRVKEGETSIVWGRSGKQGIDVTWSAFSGSATVGVDAAIAPSGSFYVPAGNIRLEETYTIIDDNIYEGEEYFLVDVKWDGKIVDNAKMIIDDEADRPTLMASSVTRPSQEGSFSVAITLTATRPADEAYTIQVHIPGGYGVEATSTSVTMPAFATQATANIIITSAPDEETTFNVEFNSSVAGGANASITLTTEECPIDLGNGVLNLSYEKAVAEHTKLVAEYEKIEGTIHENQKDFDELIKELQTIKGDASFAIVEQVLGVALSVATALTGPLGEAVDYIYNVLDTTQSAIEFELGKQQGSDKEKLERSGAIIDEVAAAHAQQAGMNVVLISLLLGTVGAVSNMHDAYEMTVRTIEINDEIKKLNEATQKLVEEQATLQDKIDTLRECFDGEGSESKAASAVSKAEAAVPQIITLSDSNDNFAMESGYALINGGNGFDTISLLDTGEFAGSIRAGGGSFIVGDEGTGVAVTGVERVALGDGRTVAFDLEGVAGQAYRIYQAAFDRTPDTGGLSFWIKNMDNGHTLMEVANWFIGSAEFAAAYGTQVSNGDLVQRLYQNVLGREGEAGGVSYWVSQLDAGMSRAQVLAGFSESAENIAGVAPAIADGIWYV